METKTYKDLIVWQKSKKLVIEVYNLTDQFSSKVENLLDEVMRMLNSFILNFTRYSLNSQKGVSLLELIIYIAVFSVVSLVMVNIFFVTMRGRDLANARYEISQNLRFATENIRQAVFDASAISVSGSCPSNILNVTSTIGSATSSFFISSDVLKFSNVSGTSDITTAKVIATSTSPSDCLFTIIDNPAPAKSTLQVKLKIVYNSQGRSDLDISDSRQMTVSLR